ncbi:MULTISPECIES: SDR family oxidoreductase [unclassified Duganella]|uniref:SDR family oxidoreductase n=1 Tax=unclassified Duganella TaxID=2636909 RepID=UPI00088013D4|nr:MULTISPECIES: SDR family oxidoreductase [unclassified Duganella]SDG64489.1 Nucleoside-diphosphate-sugar epimerase [Duganella sp. OV458]SDJ89562.1 Nucleoside-diphosphate-sugar epimerase [Duganella sp. OV510]
MKVFVTGATGWVGSAIIQELIAAGHKVLGLARSDDGAALLRDRDIAVHRGELSDLEALQAGARACDGVIHTAFIHDFKDFNAAGETDRRAIEAMGDALAGSGKPLITTSGSALLPHGRLGTESDAADPHGAAQHRTASEALTLALAGRGVRSSLVRLPPSVHGDGDYGFAPRLVDIARAKGVSAYIGDGENRWPAVHRTDAARLYRLVLEHGVGGARYHAIAEQGIATRKIAEVIGQGLGLPVVSMTAEQAHDHFGFLARFFGADCPASSALTQQQLGWQPSGPGLIEDLERHYFRS